MSDGPPHPQPYVCVTAPCGPYTPSAAVQAILTSASAPNAWGYSPPMAFGTPDFTQSSWAGPARLPFVPSIVAVAANASVASDSGISDLENAEIDAALAERESRAERIEQLSEFTSTIHPDRLLDIAGNIAEGRFAGPPPPPQRIAPPTAPETLAPNIFTQPVGRPGWIASVDETPRAPEPDLLQTPTNGEQSMDLSDILGTVSQLADIYTTIRPPQQAVAMPINPSTGQYEGSWQDWVDGPSDILRPSNITTPPSGGTTMATPYAGGCISQRDQRIAAASGVSAEAVDRVLHYARQGRRRRRRMLTKSDIGDISTMRQILGGGKAFEVWLAKATR